MYVESSKLTPNQSLRAMAREQLKGNWGKAVLATLILLIIAGIAGAIPYLGAVICIVITGPLTLGFCGFFLKIKRGEAVSIENVFDGFKQFVPSLVLYILTSIFIFLWTLLLIVPGIIATLRYSQAYFIMKDNPDIKAMDAIRKSKEMMMGQKGKLFLLYLSFIGWALLCVLTLGIGYLWLIPYIQTSLANFYEDLKNAAANQSAETAEGPAPTTA